MGNHKKKSHFLKLKVIMKNREFIFNQFADAKKNKYAIPGFNFDNLEMLKAIVEVSNEQKVFVFAMATESAAKYMGIEYVNALKKICDNNKYVAFHWDHGFDKQLALDAIKNKWHSVMHDASKLDFKNNIKDSLEVKNYAVENDIWTESEIGPIGGKEDDHESNNNSTTSINEAINFYNEVKPDMLAIAVGTAHGLYKGEVKINFDLIKEFNEQIPNSFLVLHGGSGVPDSLIIESIKCGITKINFGTELKIAYANGIKEWFDKNQNKFDARKFGRYAIDKVKEVILKKIKLCRS